LGQLLVYKKSLFFIDKLFCFVRKTKFLLANSLREIKRSFILLQACFAALLCKAKGSKTKQSFV
jgi:hypothetical protein